MLKTAAIYRSSFSLLACLLSHVTIVVADELSISSPRTITITIDCSDRKNDGKMCGGTLPPHTFQKMMIKTSGIQMLTAVFVRMDGVLL